MTRGVDRKLIKLYQWTIMNDGRWIDERNERNWMNDDELRGKVIENGSRVTCLLKESALN